MTRIDTSQMDASTKFRYENVLDAMRVNEADGTTDTHTYQRLVEMRAAIEAGMGVRKLEAPNTSDPERKAGGSTGANQFGAYKVRSASGPQLGYIGRLMREQQVPEPAPSPFDKAIARYSRKDGSLSVREASDLIDWLNTLPTRQGSTEGRPAGRKASEKQLASIVREGARRNFSESEHAGAVARIIAEANETPDQVLFSHARLALDVLFAAPFLPRTKKVQAELDAGIYQLADGTIYKVQKAYHGSGNMYAKRLVILDDTVSPAEVEFRFESGAISKLTPADKMSQEAARRFGQLYGVCCRCGTILTDEESIARGTGPVCDGKF